MAANNSVINSSIVLTDLDFFGLKNSFKNYLRGQDQFRDYDFDGAALNVLLEVLAQNAYKSTWFTNMLFSEGFIDSAQLRSSLFSHAKELNYLPRSIRSAKASVQVTFQASGDSQPYVIPKGSQFATLIKSEAYTFSTPETIVAVSGNSTFTFQTDIYEGVYVKDAYTFLADKETQRFPITNRNVDTTSVTVSVFEDGAQVGDIYQVTNTLLDLNDQSKVFFLQTSETGNYEIYFGDNVLGRQPKLNSTIIIDYRVSAGTKGNGARIFSVDFDPTGSNELTPGISPSLTVLEVSKNGAEAEDNESIRYYAPRSFQVQERAVTSSDYEILLKQQFPEINAVSVYGGEEVNPPQFGRVFVAVDIANVEGIPESKRDEYTQFLSRRSPFSIKPTVVDPDTTYIGVSVVVRYNLNVTTNSSARIKTLVLAQILSYNTTFLNDFNVTFRLSPFMRIVDASDISLVSNITKPYIYKKTNPKLATLQNIDVNFDIPLRNDLPPKGVSYPASDEKTVYSSIFQYKGQNCVLEDDGDGKIRIVKFELDNRVKITDVGTVDYATGTVKIIDFNIDSYSGAALKIYAVPADDDISSRNNVLLTMETDEISIDVQSIRV